MHGQYIGIGIGSKNAISVNLYFSTYSLVCLDITNRLGAEKAEKLVKIYWFYRDEEEKLFKLFFSFFQVLQILLLFVWYKKKAQLTAQVNFILFCSL